MAGPAESSGGASDQPSWATVHRELREASSVAQPEELWRLSTASYLLGREDDFMSSLEEAHRLHIRAGDHSDAARAAFWISLHLANRGEGPRAGGWLARAARLVEQAPVAIPARGYLLVAEAHRALASGDNDASARAAEEAAAIGQRHEDADLFALALHLHGRAWLRSGRIERGLALLDETMVALATDRLSPVTKGIVYCSVIGACREVHALGRVREWTAALTAWCERQPDMVAFKGRCRGYRAELLLRRGEWRAAIQEAERAADALANGPEASAVGFAHYQRGEAHRLLGEISSAEDAFREASRHGFQPLPGLALLRLEQGRDAAAEATLRRALAESSGNDLAPMHLLPAYVEILVAIGDVAEARRACSELEAAARRCAEGALAPAIAQARGHIALADGRPEGALVSLREAWSGWRRLDAPYEAARVRLLLGRACRDLGDEDGATLELETARAELERLGAVGRLVTLDADDPRPAFREHGLTRRESEVLSWLATGGTNRSIAESLSISEKTVARHLSNIYRKLGLSSRAAATAYAYRHGLATPPT